MSFIRKTDTIDLTYYVSPHHFYFKYKNDSRGDVILSEINNKIEKYVSRHIEKRHAVPFLPQTGEIVLCHYISDCVYKWIRARVDIKLTYDKDLFILWAIDYGFPIASECRWIRPILCDELKVVEKGLIFKAGLFEIVPSTVELNFLDSVEESRKTKKWSTRAIESVEKYLHEADDLTFTCRAYYEDHFFGSLIIQSITGTKLVVADYLNSMKEGVESLNFLKEFSRLENQPYWQRQSQDAIYKVYENNTDHTVAMDVTTLWASTDDHLNKNETKTTLPKLLNKNDQKSAQPEETMINLCHQLEASTKLSTRSGNISMNSLKISTAQTDKPVSLPSNVQACADNGANIPTIPMKNRLAIAQQKLAEQGKMLARKQSRIDEINKKVMGLTFPAGFIVDTKAIKDQYKHRQQNQSKTADESAEKKSSLHYQIAIENEECSSFKHVDRILVHDDGSFLIRRINDINDADFSQGVHTALKELNINQVFRIQSVGWPGILRGLSMIFVSSAKTGKTWTYLPAICTLTIQRIQDKQTVEGCGPLLIIACASSKDVNQTTFDLEHLLRYNDSGIKCFKSYGLEHDVNVMGHLLSGTEILVTTVPSLYRLMADELNLFNKERILSLVFDNIDLVYERFGREIREIHKALCDPSSDVQMIVTSRTWLKILENFYTESDSVVLCIGSYIEAAVYAKTEMTVELLGQKFKIDKLISYLKNINYHLELTIVICNTPEDVNRLLATLKPIFNNIWHLHDKLDSSEIGKIKELINNGKSKHFSLLICTDEVFRDLNIRCAQHIVHFVLPASWTMFAFRFSALFDHLENLRSKKSDHKPATSMVFLDEKNNDELPRLIDFMQMRANCVIPDQVLKFAELKRIENEEKVSNIYKPFCNDLVTIGVCHGGFTCRQRHILTKFDRSRNEIPQMGYVKFEVIAVHSPIHYTARLLAHRQPHIKHWTKLQSTDDFSSFNIEMLKYFEDEENQVLHLPIALGDLCAIQTTGENKSFERGQIVKIEETKYCGKATHYWVDILLVDSNERMSCLSSELLLLPDKFKNFPYQAVDVRIAGIVPRHFDNEYDKDILTLVRQWIQNHYCQGFIKLSIMNTLWVDTIGVIEVLQSINEQVSSLSIKRNLLDRKFCVLDSKPFELLMGLKEKADRVGLTPTQQVVDLRRTTKGEGQIFYKSDDEGFDLDESNPSLLNWTMSSDDENENVNLKKSTVSSTQNADFGLDKWAELTANQFNKVLLCDFYHPNRIYIRNDCYSSRFIELNKSIDAFVAIQENLIPLANVSLMEHCLAKIGDRFGRAKILKLFHNDDGITAEVFYVDFGESITLPSTELIEIPKKFVTTLPFQAIFCQLIGVRPKNSSEWCDNVCDQIYDELLAKQAHLYAIIRSLQLAGPDTYAYGLKSSSYEVVLLDETGNVNINNWIVSNEYGEWVPDTKHFVDVALDGDMLALLNRHSSDESEMESNGIPLVDDDDSFDIQFDEDDIMKLLEANKFLFTCNKVTEPTPAKIEEIYEKETTNTALVNEPRTEKISSVDKIECELVSEHRFPLIKWHQTESMVVLAVHAPDVKDYFLRVKPRTVEVSFIYDNEKFAALLNLFGCVDVQYTSHGIRGLNVVIRLVKTLNGLSWPRLIQANEKSHFIMYNFEADGCLVSQELDFEATNDSANSMRQQGIDYSSGDEDTDGEFGFD